MFVVRFGQHYFSPFLSSYPKGGRCLGIKNDRYMFVREFLQREERGHLQHIVSAELALEEATDTDICQQTESAGTCHIHLLQERTLCAAPTAPVLKSHSPSPSLCLRLSLPFSLCLFVGCSGMLTCTQKGLW